MQPVGNTIVPPNPNQALNTLSSILGVKQQQLALQTGQAALPGVAAQSQQQQTQATGAQISLGERQRVQQIISSGVDDQGNSILTSDGKVDPDKAMQWMPRVAPTTYPQYLQNIQTTQANKLTLAQSTASLGQTYRDQLGSILQTFVNDPTFNSQKAASLLTPYGAQNPEAAPVVASTLALLKNTDSIQGDPKTMLAKKNDALVHIIQSLKPSAGNVPTTVSNNAAVIPGSTQPLTGTFTPSGGAVPLAPGPRGGPAYAGATAAATARAGGAAGLDLDRASQVSKAIQPSQAAIPITKEIDTLADQIYSGKFAAEISAAAAAAHMQDATYARQILVKDLGQVRSAAIKNAPSDEARDTMLSGYPDSTADPQTIHTSMDYVRGSLRQNVERGNQLIQMRQKDPSLTGFAQADDQLTNTRNPYMSEYKALSPGSQRQQFLQRHFKNAQEAQAFVEGANGP